jgi:mono/diheme cytochrome c family protein
MMKKFFLPILIFSLTGCLNNVEDVAGEVQIEVSFSNDVQPIFIAKGCIGCHSSGGFNMSSYESLINSNGIQYGNNIIVVGDADASGLVDKIEPNPQEGRRMPNDGNFLSGNEIQTIRAWINEGALNN